MSNPRTLEEALKELMADDGKVTKFEARELREMILADGKISDDERKLLHKAMDENKLDQDAYKLLGQMLLRADSDRKKSLFGW